VNSVPAERAGTASGVLNTCRQIGGALSIAFFGTLIAQRESFLSGLRISPVIAAVLLLATASASLLLPPGGTHLREIHDGPPHAHETEKGDAPIIDSTTS
jgi:DHA2 family methylenomycin A resistance protein-like MFS transporter